MVEGKTILITGSSRGIGAATAQLAKAYGACVVLHGKEESDALTALAESLEAPYIYCDIGDERAVGEAVAEVLEMHERIDALVQCAGVSKPNTFLNTPDEEWIDVFKTNVLGIAHFAKALIPHMTEHGGGRIVNVASIRGHKETPGRATYSVSKAAVINLTAVLAREFAPDIAVNAVSPGFTKTDFSKKWNDATWAQAASSLVGRAAEPEEIAEAILFLASDRASFINGQTITVDGGYSMAGK